MHPTVWILSLFEHQYFVRISMTSLTQHDALDSHEKMEDSIIPTVDNGEKSPIESGDAKEEDESPGTPEVLEQWNNPRINLYRYLATIYSFIILGMNDAAYGV